ncbi:MAG: TetR/AcrR family transcriptional regulator [Treponema sp.]|nr:TetR/AcrR family transcriptional regulator [Treponema sp.]
MAIVVEHDKRKHDILQKSLDVFIEEGYEDATFQKIADRCGITRTTLYIYFKNKHEIFLGSIKELLSALEVSLAAILADDSLTTEEALRQILNKIIDYCEESQKLFLVLLSYFMQLKKSGIDIEEKIRRRVVRLRHLLSTIMIRGIQNKEFKNMNVKEMNELLYGLIESAIFRLTVLNQKDISDIRKTLDLAVDGFLLKE